jgi:Big-like domain-containing protein
MKPAKNFFHFLLFTSLVCILITISSGCAQIGAPTGGPKDTLSPVLVIANPPVRTLHFNGNKIVFTFNEYIDVQDVSSNLLVSPYPKKNPSVTNKLKTVTVILKDSLLPNTTYSINFGNAIKDIDEGNILKNFTYVFSTGNIIDSEQVKGNVVVAETGKTDSTIFVLLYNKDLSDTAVLKKKPNYIARVDKKGNFVFNNLPPGDFNIYALKDDDGSKTYSAKSELFAFTGQTLHVSDTTQPVMLYAYAEEEKPVTPTSTSDNTTTTKKKIPKDNKLKFVTSLDGGDQSLLTDLYIAFNKPLEHFDSTGIVLTDTNFNAITPVNITVDSTRQIVSLHTTWTENTDYRLIINKNAVTDSDSVSIKKTDTLAFKTKSESEYGSILIRILNFDKSKHPVLEILKDFKIVKSIPLTTAEWSDKLFVPGEYYIRILFDDNNNGKWDPGSYSEKRQPEKVISFDKKLSIKADWDNEREIQL